MLFSFSEQTPVGNGISLESKQWHFSEGISVGCPVLQVSKSSFQEEFSCSESQDLAEGTVLAVGDMSITVRWTKSVSYSPNPWVRTMKGWTKSSIHRSLKVEVDFRNAIFRPSFKMSVESDAYINEPDALAVLDAADGLGLRTSPTLSLTTSSVASWGMFSCFLGVLGVVS